MNIPGIKGDATDKAYQGLIPLTSFSEGFMSSGRAGGASTGRGTSRLVCQALQVVKPLDSSSPAITAAVATGQAFRKIDLAATTSREIPFTCLKFALHNAVISSVTFGGDRSTSARVETLSVTAPKVEVTYWPQQADGTRAAARRARRPPTASASIRRPRVARAIRVPPPRPAGPGALSG